MYHFVSHKSVNFIRSFLMPEQMNGVAATNGSVKYQGHEQPVQNGSVHETYPPPVSSFAPQSSSHPHESHEEMFEEPPLLIAFFTYVGYAILVIFGYIKDFYRKIGLVNHLQTTDPREKEVKTLYQPYTTLG